MFGVKPRHVLGWPEDAEERAAGPEQAQTFCLLRTSGISVVYVGNKGGQWQSQRSASNQLCRNGVVLETVY